MKIEELLPLKNILIHHYLAIFLHKNIFCDPSLELSHQDSSKEVSQHMFPLRNNKNYLRIILNTPSYPQPGRVPQSVACLTQVPEVPGLILSHVTYFCYSFR